MCMGAGSGQESLKTNMKTNNPAQKAEPQQAADETQPIAQQKDAHTPKKADGAFDENSTIYIPQPKPWLRMPRFVSPRPPFKPRW